MSYSSALVVGMLWLMSSFGHASLGHASEVHVVQVPELNVFRRPSVTSERIATWQRNDVVTAGRSHIDDEGIAWVLACRAQECGWVEEQFLSERLPAAAAPDAGDRNTQPPRIGTDTKLEPQRASVTWRQLSVTAQLGGKEGGSGVLGAHIVRVDELSALEAPSAPGAVVWALGAGGAAEGAGLRMFDVVTRFGGEPVKGPADLVALVQAAVPGAPKEIVLLRPDIDAAIVHFEPHCEQASSHACASLGLLYMAKRDWTAAFRWSFRAADIGGITGMLNVANLYDAGLGIKRDKQEAIRWYSKAAEKGNPNAMNRLGIAYSTGVGVVKDPVEAVRWYRRAAEKGFASGMLNLGRAYAEGHGLLKNEQEAVRWYRKAAEQDNGEAMATLAAAYYRGMGVALDYGEAARWYRKAAEKGIAHSMYNLAVLYANGQGVPMDQTEAVRWYRKAAERGFALGMHQLGLNYGQGRGIAKDSEKGAEWIFRSLQAGSEESKAYMLQYFDRGDPAFRRALQRNLQRAGVYDGAVDGKFGPATKRAIEALVEKSKIPSGAETAVVPFGAEALEGRTGQRSQVHECGGRPGGRPCLQAVGSPSDPPIAMHERARAWAEIVGQIPAGAAGIASLGETAVSASVKWLHVEYRGIRGWVPAEFLKVEADDKPPRPQGRATDDALKKLPPLPKLEKLE